MLHFNKGLAGTNAADVAAAKDTAMNPAVLDAFALAIIAGGDPAAYADLLGHPRDLAKAREDAAAISRAGDELRKVVPNAGSYVSESNYFERNWQRSFWGAELSSVARGEAESTIPKACSSSTMASAARAGAPTASLGSSRSGKLRFGPLREATPP